jgi:hypothetical protein
MRRYSARVYHVPKSEKRSKRENQDPKMTEKSKIAQKSTQNAQNAPRKIRSLKPPTDFMWTTTLLTEVFIPSSQRDTPSLRHQRIEYAFQPIPSGASANGAASDMNRSEPPPGLVTSASCAPKIDTKLDPRTQLALVGGACQRPIFSWIWL